VQIVKTAIDNAFAGYEQVTKATKQAVASVEEQIAKASALVEQNTATPAKPAKPARSRKTAK
jgi:hypothetical protein